MRTFGITYPDANNGIGFRVTLWVAGCKHHCHGCHNIETWDFNGGEDFTQEDKNKLFDVLGMNYIKGLTLSGGDPLYSYESILKLSMEVKEKFKNKDIWLYTGFTKKYVDENFSEILDYVDFIVDGKFDEKLKDLSLPFRGSKNQKIWKKDENGVWSECDDSYFQN